MRNAANAIALLLPILAITACASPEPSPSTAFVLPGQEEKATFEGFVERYLRCLHAEAARYRKGGASVELAVETSETTCGRSLDELERYAAVKRIMPNYTASYMGEVAKRGRALAVESATAVTRN